MKAWELWGIGAFLAVGMACNGGGLTTEQPNVRIPQCQVGDESCEEGQECIGLESQEVGEEGICQNKPECRTGEEGNVACAEVHGEAWECKGTESQSPGAAGSCVDTAECRTGPEGNAACAAAHAELWECEGRATQSPGAINSGAVGTCVDRAACRVGGSRCEGELCIGLSSREVGAAGECMPQTLGELCQRDEECNRWEICEGEAETEKVCVYGERQGVVLSNFQIRINGQLVVPLRVPGATQNNPQAGWVGQSEAELSVVARGPNANVGLVVQTSTGFTLDTANQCATTGCTSTHCQWSCSLPAGWTYGYSNGQIGVEAGMDSQPQPLQQWVYRVSEVLPTLSLVALPSTRLLGEELRVCLMAATTEAPLANIVAPVLRIEDNGTPLPLQWTAGLLAGGQRCWASTLPLTLAWSGATRLEVSAQAVDTAGNTRVENYSVPLTLTRLACSSTVSASSNLTAPLAFAAGRLLIASAATLHFFDVAACPATSTVVFSAGTSVQGPMVVLGDNLAIATSGNGGQAARTFMLDAAAAQPGVVVDSLYCASDSSDIPSGTRFDQGLSLLSLNPARFAVPANRSSGTSMLVAYTPFAASLAERCMVSSPNFSVPVALPLAQDSRSRFLVTHSNILWGTPFSTWSFGTGWGPGTWTGSNNSSTGELSGMALHGESLWLSMDGRNTLGYPGPLQLWREGEAVVEPAIPDNTVHVTAAAIDERGRAYVVGFHENGGVPDGYSLTRLTADGSIEQREILPVGSTGLNAISPLLGEPPQGGNPELYVVRGNGRVLAYHAENLQELWRVDLGFSVFAQPVLVPHAEGGGTLWVVGAGGQIRGIRVASNGLSRTAIWPKAFHDNCNTSSSRVTASATPTPDQWSMPRCF
ncbi:MAG: hypothetical protein FWG75_09120 [Cystobacterineae bacterium]|nr:hypothetical protein [Cystobacterineae bacterium]